MRADRLIAMLMLLQSHGMMTAQKLAEELEVTERTVYRDVNALSYSGVPIYTERGPGGGIALVEQYRSDLTGLNKNEVRALFMLSIPPALVELGLDQEIRTAMLKLSAALPAVFQGDEQRVRQRIHLDPVPWREIRSNISRSNLHTLHVSVWESQVLEVSHRSLLRPDVEPMEIILHPLGLIAKTRDWYLIAKRADHFPVIRVDRIQDIRLTGEKFTRPEDFDLVRFWERWCQDHENNRPSYPVRIRASGRIANRLHYFLDDGIQQTLRQVGDPDEGGWITVDLEFDYLDQARTTLFRLGGAIEVLEPIALRYSMKDYANQILNLYQDVIINTSSG